jgi:proline iminopeptidase
MEQEKLMGAKMNDQSEQAYAFPHIEPLLAEHVAVGDGHSLWVEQSGARSGLPVVSLHGGPGVPFDAADRRLFDPGRFTLFQFDQRGVGRSIPHAETRANSVWHTVADLELLRTRYGIERWIVTGHSFGTTIALAYAQKYPDRCAALLLRGLYLSTNEEREWAATAWRMMWPDAWADTLARISPGAPEDYYDCIAAQLEHPDHEVRAKAADAYARFELNCCFADPTRYDLDAMLDPESNWANAVIAMHFGANDDFLEPDQILRDIHILRDIPAIVVNGRNDVVTPPAPAWRLKTLWPELDLRFAPLSGHMSIEPGNIMAVTQAADDLADRLAPQTCWTSRTAAQATNRP